MQEHLFYFEDANVIDKLATSLTKAIPNDFRGKIALICIGTDRSTGDSYGPFVGSLLSLNHLQNFDMYGTIANPIHGLNIEDMIETLNNNYHFVIALDSALGMPDSINKIKLIPKPIIAGGALGNNHPAVGHIGVLGIVGIIGRDIEESNRILRNVRLNDIFKMASVTKKAFVKVDHFLSDSKKLIFRKDNETFEKDLSQPSNEINMYEIMKMILELHC